MSYTTYSEAELGNFIQSKTAAETRKKNQRDRLNKKSASTRNSAYIMDANSKQSAANVSAKTARTTKPKTNRKTRSNDGNQTKDVDSKSGQIPHTKDGKSSQNLELGINENQSQTNQR